MEKQITIRAPRPILDKWLAALRSGDYKQCTQVMHDGRNGYYCLGLLQAVTTGAIEDDEWYAMPAADWLERMGIRFDGTALEGTGAMGRSPYLPALDANAHIANDNGATFAQIADAIEACAEGY